MEQRPALSKILPNIIKLGLPMPRAALEAPEMWDGLDLYWEAFVDLSTCRGGMGDGPIPWDRAAMYAQHHGMDEEESEDLWFFLTRLDEAWLDHQEKKRKSGKS